MPLAAPLRLLELGAIVKPKLRSITQPSLVMHSRRDHTCPMKKNLSFVMKNLGSPEKRGIQLEESYHVITVDSEKELVANEVIDFVERFRVAPQKRAAS
jgi:carboxylesterase